MIPSGEVIIESMDDEGAVADEAVSNGAAVEAIGWSAADAFGETESEETDTGHKLEDDADETHFLPPGTLALWCAKT